MDTRFSRTRPLERQGIEGDVREQESFLIVNECGVIVYVKPLFAQLLRYDVESLLYKPLEHILIWPKTFEEVVRCGTSIEKSTVMLLDREGGLYSGEYTIQRGFCRQPYIFSFFQLTSKEQSEILRRFSDCFISDINLGIVLIDMAFRLVEMSETACHIFGVSRNAVIGLSIDNVFSALPEEHRFIQRNLLQGVTVSNHAVSWINNTQRHDLMMDSNVIKNTEGTVIGAYVTFKDVTSLRSLEQQVQRNDRLAMIGQIAAGTAHEIRNPLTSIKGFMQLLRFSLEQQGMERECSYTDLILTEINRINELVNEFLFLSKPRNSTYMAIDVATVIREILPLINNQAILHDITVQYHSVLDVPMVIADRELLKQVIINLCRNGIEAMSMDGGILTIFERVDVEQQCLTIAIRDTGSGIPPFLIDKIFDPFFTTKEEGTGLGLAVCQRIVHDIGGSIRVSSKGYGTVFIVSVPIAVK